MFDFGCRAKLEPEGAAVSGIRIHTDPAAHSRDDFAHHGQADPGAFVLIVSMEFVKHVKDSMLRFLRNPYTVVLERYPHHFSLYRRPDSDARFLAGAHELHGIPEDV